MPSASNAKSEKPAPSEGAESSALRQIMILVEHKIRNLEKRKSKLTSYRDLQKSGKDLNADQKIAVAKYDEVAQTLEFTRELFKQISAIVAAADREAKKQAKKEAWVRIAAETSRMRELLIIIDCLTQMGSPEARDDFLSGAHGAVKLTEDDLKILDDIYPEVTPKHEVDEEGNPSFQIQTTKAVEHLYAIIEGKPKEVLGTTYARIKEVIMTIQDCGYFDRVAQNEEATSEVNQAVGIVAETADVPEETGDPELVLAAGALPVPPAPAVVPAPAYPLRPLPPITLQEVEHAYFAQQYPQQARPIAEVIGSQNFVFIQDSEIDSPVGTPQPPPILNQASPPAPIPTQTFTNQHFVPMAGARVAPEPASYPIPQPHFAPPPEHAAFAQPPPPGHHIPLPPHSLAAHVVQSAHLSPHAHDQSVSLAPMPVPALQHQLPPRLDVVENSQPAAPPAPVANSIAVAPAPALAPSAPVEDDDDWREEQSPELEDATEKGRAHGQGDGQNRYRRFGRGGRGAPNGYRGRGGYQRPPADGYHNRQNDYQPRQNKDGYQSRQNDGFANRNNKDGYHQNRGNDNYYGNGDSGNGGNGAHHDDNGTTGRRDRYDQNYQGGYKSRGRGGGRGAPRGAPRARPAHHHYGRKPDNAD